MSNTNKVPSALVMSSDGSQVELFSDTHPVDAYKAIYKSDPVEDADVISELEMAQRFSAVMMATIGTVCIPLENREGEIVAINYVPASPDDPSVSHFYAMGDFVDEYGEWHADGLPDGVKSFDPDRVHMVPVFDFEEVADA
tara:strand:- start:1175 stop:1597 length:423 start_codon:yes stop_codon:yes gene_type:complete